jgi:hypothetical protein
MKNILITLIAVFLHQVAGKNFKQIKAEEVNQFLINANRSVDPKNLPKSNSSRDFLELSDEFEAELNTNAYNEIQSAD